MPLGRRQSHSQSEDELLLGLDLSTNVGFAVLRGEERLASGTWRLQPKRHRGDRWTRFLDNMAGILGEFEPTIIAFENLSRGQGRTMQGRAVLPVFGGFLAHLEVISLQTGIELLPVNPSSWKKLSTGKGNANKPLYIKAMGERFGLKMNEKREDEAAALGIAEAARILRERGE